jgi:hypothetical protein
VSKRTLDNRPPSTCEDRVLTLTIHMVRNNSLFGEGVRVSLPNSRLKARFWTIYKGS